MDTRTAKTAEKEYSEENPRPREEFAREFIRALGGAIKDMENGIRNRPLDDLLDELDAYVEEERKNGRS